MIDHFSAYQRLQAIAEELQNGGVNVQPISVREFLGWFGAKRRGSWIVERIRQSLDQVGLVTDPDFESLYIDSEFEFRKKPDSMIQLQPVTLGATATVGESAYADPTYRLSKLEAANRIPVSVVPTASLVEAITLMVANDFSQLPVMSGERDVKGVISWNAIGSRLGLGVAVEQVRDAMDAHYEVSAGASLFEAIPIIVKNQYVLVRAPNQKIVGIVTASDLSLQFQQLTEPFLLIGEIENHIRRILDEKFAKEDLSIVKDDNDPSRAVERVSDLTFGEYLRLIENPDRWAKLGVNVERRIILAKLERVRSIRNDVMHFDPDGIPPEDLDHLRSVVQLLQRLQDIGVS